MRALLIAALLCASDVAVANPVDLFGFGARAPAMGGAQTAATQDSSANYYNPAALALQAGLRIDVGYQTARPTLRMNTASQQVNDSRGLAAGLVVPGNFLGRRVAIGAGLFLPDQSILTGRTLSAEQPRWALYDNRPKRLFFGFHAAAEIRDDLYLGAGLASMAGAEGTYIIGGRLGFPIPDDSELELDVDVDATSSVYLQAGALWKPTPWLDVGLAYRGQFVFESIQIVRFEADIGSPGNLAVEDAIVDIETLNLDFFQPAQVAFGIAAQITPRVLIAFDAVYQRWSKFENPTPIIDIELDVGDLNDLVMLDEQPKLERLHFHDTLSPRLGVEVLAARTSRTEWRIRAGYAYDPSPAPEQVRSSNFIDNDKHTVSAGLGLRLSRVTDILPRPFDLDLYGALTMLPRRDHHKLSPVDPTGDISAEGHVIAFGVSSSWAF